MTQRSGKFTRGPCVVDISHGGPCTEIEALDAAEMDCEPFNLSVVNLPDIGAQIVWDSRIKGETEKAEANAHLIAHALNAATTAEDMGYDGQAAVEALPELLRAVKALLLLAGETSNRTASYENCAAAFHHETGKLAPGKDVPAAASDIAASPEEYEAWGQKKIDAAAATLAACRTKESTPTEDVGR